jgi:hypothetical protein
MKGVGAGSRVFELLDRKSAIPLSVGKFCPKERNGPIRLENVSFTYPSRKEVGVLNGVNLDIEVGTSLAIWLVFAMNARYMTMAHSSLDMQRSKWQWKVIYPSSSLSVLRSQRRKGAI